ncbi:GPR4 protein, partial [Amia calva]|nr:GPR4 protein [Amia calva]
MDYITFPLDIFILVIGVPAICLAIYSLYRMIRANMVVPFYIINLLISDLLQLTMKSAELAWLSTIHKSHFHRLIAYFILFRVLFYFGLSASVLFMLCIALERYLLVAHPLWYRCRRRVRPTMLVCAGIWLLALTFTTVLYTTETYHDAYISLVHDILFFIFFLLPFPLLIFFFISTRRAIAGATCLRDTEKRRIVCMLALVLCIYTMLFLPYCIVHLMINYSLYDITPSTALITMQIMHFSVLVDPVLYILLRPDVRNTLCSLPCCQRLFTLTTCWTPRAEQETGNTVTVCPTETSV